MGCGWSGSDLGLDLGRWRTGSRVSLFDMPKGISSGGKCGALSNPFSYFQI